MISIIIPTYNEEEGIGNLIHYLNKTSDGLIKEIIVSDGGSNDRTVQVAKEAGGNVVISPQKGRAAQMNYGASVATSDILYFIHADTFPPLSFCNDIKKSLHSGYEFGRYRTRFDSKKWILSVNAFFTRFDLFVCYGGDQSLYITKQLFFLIGGYNASMFIMEDYEIIVRAKALARYKVISKDAMVSARKYDTNSWFKVQLANYTIVRMYKKGASQEDMVKKYKELLQYR